MRLPRPAWLLFVLGLLMIHVPAGRRIPIGFVEDEAVHLLLARSIRHGAFTLPTGLPVTDPLPGFAAVLALPVRLCGPHWILLRILCLGAAAAMIRLAWEICLLALPPSWAAGVLLLVAFNPAFVNQSALVTPDVCFTMLSLALFLLLAREAPLWKLIFPAALAALLRPHGLFLCAALGLGIGVRDGLRKAGIFLSMSLAPLALWILRNFLATGSPTDYVTNWRAGTAYLAEGGGRMPHIMRLSAALFGEGLLGLTGAGASAGATAAVLLAGFGALRLLRRGSEPWAFALACYAIFVLSFHSMWLPAQPRYVLPLLPALWLWIAVGLEAILSGRRAIVAGLFVLASSAALRLDAGLAWDGFRAPTTSLQPETMGWIRSRTRPQALFENLRPGSIMLWSGRPAVHPPIAADPEAWLAASRRRGVEFLKTDPSWWSSSYALPGTRAYAQALERWARSSRGVEEVYRNDAEGTSIFRIRGSDPAPAGKLIQ